MNGSGLPKNPVEVALILYFLVLVRIQVERTSVHGGLLGNSYAVDSGLCMRVRSTDTIWHPLFPCDCELLMSIRDSLVVLLCWGFVPRLVRKNLRGESITQGPLPIGFNSMSGLDSFCRCNKSRSVSTQEECSIWLGGSDSDRSISLWVFVLRINPWDLVSLR